MKTNRVVHTANRFAIIFDGKVIGALQSVSAQDSYGLEGAYEIGSINPIEHVPTAATYSISVSKLLLIKGDMLSAGIAVENGEAALKGLVFDIEYYDKDGATLLRKWSGVSYDSGGIDVQKNAIVVQSGQFKALNVTGTGV